MAPPVDARGHYRPFAAVRPCDGVRQRAAPPSSSLVATAQVARERHVEWDGAGWALVATSGPVAPFGHGAAYDSQATEQLSTEGDSVARRNLGWTLELDSGVHGRSDTTAPRCRDGVRSDDPKTVLHGGSQFGYPSFRRHLGMGRSCGNAAQGAFPTQRSGHAMCLTTRSAGSSSWAATRSGLHRRPFRTGRANLVQFVSGPVGARSGTRDGVRLDPPSRRPIWRSNGHQPSGFTGSNGGPIPDDE